jgi:hypothetical protein
VSCDDLEIQEPFESVNFGHTFFKAYQYVNVDEIARLWFGTSEYEGYPIYKRVAK